MPKQHYGRTFDEWEERSKKVIGELYEHAIKEVLASCRVEEGIYRPAALGILIKLASLLCGYAISEARDIAELQEILKKVQQSVTDGTDSGISVFFQTNPHVVDEVAKMMETEGNA